MVKVFSTDRACFLRKNGECIRSRCGPAMSRTTVDKLELRLALFEYDGVFHSLTFAPENLPANRKEVQQIWNTYLKRLKRWAAAGRSTTSIASRGCMTACTFTFFCATASILRCSCGDCGTGARPTMYHTQKRRSCKRTATAGSPRYFTKERPEVGQHPWGPSRTLKPKVPLPEVKTSKTGRIYVPRDAVILPARVQRGKKRLGRVLIQQVFELLKIVLLF